MRYSSLGKIASCSILLILFIGVLRPLAQIKKIFGNRLSAPDGGNLVVAEPNIVLEVGLQVRILLSKTDRCGRWNQGGLYKCGAGELSQIFPRFRPYSQGSRIPGNRRIQYPPQLSDLKDFTFDSEDIKALKNCKPGDCKIQMPSSSIEDLHPWICPLPTQRTK